MEPHYIICLRQGYHSEELNTFLEEVFLIKAGYGVFNERMSKCKTWREYKPYFIRKYWHKKNIEKRVLHEILGEYGERINNKSENGDKNHKPEIFRITKYNLTKALRVLDNSFEKIDYALDIKDMKEDKRGILIGHEGNHPIYSNILSEIKDFCFEYSLVDNCKNYKGELKKIIKKYEDKLEDNSLHRYTDAYFSYLKKHKMLKSKLNLERWCK